MLRRANDAAAYIADRSHRVDDTLRHTRREISRETSSPIMVENVVARVNLAAAAAHARHSVALVSSSLVTAPRY